MVYSGRGKLTNMAKHTILSLVRECKKVGIALSPLGTYVSNTFEAITLPLEEKESEERKR